MIDTIRHNAPQQAEFPAQETDEPDAANTPAPLPRGQGVSEAQKHRRAAHFDRSTGNYMRTKLVGMATLQTRDKTPAVRLVPSGSWDIETAKDIVAGYAWEQHKRHPAHIDPLHLARVVHEIEAQRDARNEHGAIPLAITKRNWWRCDAAIQGWIDSFRLTKDLTTDDVRKGFGQGGGGYEHRGKSIWLGILGNAVGMATMPVTNGVAYGGIAALRAAASLKRFDYDLQVGAERLKRKPREDLAPVLNLKPSPRSSKAPRTQDALDLVDTLYEAGDIAHKLRVATADRDQDAIGKLLERAAALQEAEDLIKAGLANSAVEWNGNSVQMPVRATAGALGIASGIVSLSVPASLPIVVPLAGAAIAAHLSYHFGDGAQVDAAKKLETGFMARLKSYDWINTARMTPGEIARAYGDYLKGSLDEQGLRTLLRQRDAFDMEAVAEATLLPFGVRIGMATRLLAGKFEKTRNALVATEQSLREAIAAQAQPKKIAAMQRRVDQAREALRAQAADCINFNLSVHLMHDALGSQQTSATQFDQAAEALGAVQDQHVRNLFCGSLRKQAEAGALDRQLKKGEQLKYLLSYRASSTIPSALGTAASAGGLLVEEGVNAADWVHAGLGTEPAFSRIGALKPVSVGASGVGLAASTVAPHASSLRPGFSEHYPGTGMTAKLPPVTDEKTISITMPFKLCSSRDFSDDVLRELACADMPGRLTLRINAIDAGRSIAIPLNLADTQPYFEAQIRRLGLDSVYRKEKWKTWMNLIGDGMKGAVSRPVLTFHMRATRDNRRALRQAVDEARAVRPQAAPESGPEIPMAKAATAGRRAGSSTALLHATTPDWSNTRVPFNRKRMPFLTTIPNPGGGDCLFHALAGRELTESEIVNLRREIAMVRRTAMPENPGHNALALYGMLAETPGAGEELAGAMLAEGQHVSNEMYARYQETPGMYAGIDEIIQYLKLPDHAGRTVVVVDEDGTLSRHRADRQEVLRYDESVPGRSSRDVLENALAEADIVLYKTRGHWERVERGATLALMAR